MINPQTFIQDFRDLFLKSPQCGSWTRASENCDYGDITTVSKDCYMCFNSGNCRNAYYCEDSRALNDCTDCSFCENCELVYECVDCDGCYDSDYCQDCHNCRNIKFSYDLRRCRDCVGCAGLRDKQYFIFNKKYTRAEYEKALENLDISNEKTVAEIYEKLEELKRKTPRMFVHQFDTQNCTGDYIYHSKNCHMCFDTRHTEDSGYITQANLDMGTKDSFDCGPIPTGMDLCYDVAYSHYLFNCKHLYWCGNIKDSEFCTNCFECEHIFGCHYMQHKRDGFYILNQKVDENYYRGIIPEIKKILLEQGIYTLYDLIFKDLSRDPSKNAGKKLEKITDSELKRKCEICGESFELFPVELKFYKKHEIIYPVYCPSCRDIQRFNLRNERKMYKRVCDSCKNTLISTYPPDSEYIVYCLPCYWKHINLNVES